MHPSLIPLLEKEGWTAEDKSFLSPAQVPDQLKECEGLVLRSKLPITEALLEKAPRLRFIARAGAGLEQMDLKAIEKRNIALFAANEGNRDAVAEHALGMLLCLLNHLPKADKEVRHKLWRREANRGTELMDKTVGIVGYGHTGQAFAQRLSGFGCQVLAYDKYHRSNPHPYVRQVPMEDIFAEADILSLHLPLTSETHHLANKAYLARFQKGIYLINTARGEIIETAALCEALEGGKVKGACLDVLENEKLDKLSPQQEVLFERLANSDKVLFSPHVAGWTHESYVRINEILVDKIRNWYTNPLP
jgi:D-3-phosphoglycerate dehydrogenase